MTETHDSTSDTAPTGDVDASSPSDEDPPRFAPGRVPLRIELDACLLPGKIDSRMLLIAWFVKKSFWWMAFGGAAIASVVHFVEHVEDQLQVNYRSPESVEHALLSAWALVVLAVLIRFAIGWVALALAYPLARAHEIGLPPRSGWNRHYATLSDRYKVAKAYRALRWTHHVRQVALDRVSSGPSWWRRWDPILDVINVLGVVAFFVTHMVLTTLTLSDLTM